MGVRQFPVQVVNTSDNKLISRRAYPHELGRVATLYRKREREGYGDRKRNPKKLEKKENTQNRNREGVSFDRVAISVFVAAAAAVVIA